VEERVQKILARAGIASRRASERVIEEGRVTLNGVIVRELGTKADQTRDDIRVDGVRVRPLKTHAYILLNKPRGVVSTRRDPEGRTTVMDLVPPLGGLFPVGRLDTSTEGLLLLTNDGDFAQRVLHPSFEVPRVYEAKVYRVPSPETLARLRKGISLEGQRMHVDEVSVLRVAHNAWLRLTLHEGRNHEVRRLLEFVGHPVSKLKRVGFGPLTSRGLRPGEFRYLTPTEVSNLLARARRAPAKSRSETGPRKTHP